MSRYNMWVEFKLHTILIIILNYILDSWRQGTLTGPWGSASELDGPLWQALWHKPFGTVWLVNYIPVPKEEDWRAIAAEFLERWNFPNCLGSIDRKHVVIQAPPCSASQFYNYKGTYSVVLLAVVDAIYCFPVVDVSAYGKGSDGGTLRVPLQDGTLEISPPASLTGAEDLGPVPQVFVGDEAFPLRPNLMRPYAGERAAIAKACKDL
jgi:hypothetical protein